MLSGIQCLLGAGNPKILSYNTTTETKITTNSSSNPSIINEASNPHDLNSTIISNVLQYTLLLRDTLSVDDDESEEKIKAKNSTDDIIVTWWTTILEIAVHCLLGEVNLVNEQLENVKVIPEQLLHSGDYLPNAIISILEAKIMLMK